MSHPVTTNPLIIMIINMTVVFLVLIVLGWIINLIQYIDPTRKKEKKANITTERPVKAPAAAPAPAAAAPAAAAGISPEVVAVIAAAVCAAGYSASSIRAIRPVESTTWKQIGRMQAISQD